MRKRFISLLLTLSMLLCAVPVVTAAETAPKFTKYSLTLNKSIAINFKVPHAAVVGIFEKVVFTKGDKTSEISKLPAADKDGMAVFTFKDLSPSELATSVTATLITSAGETSITRSVKDYCMSALAKETTADKLKTLIVDLLNYGSASQTWKGETELANADLTDAQKVWATKDNPELKTDVIDNTDGAITRVGLLLVDSVQIYFVSDESKGVSTLKVNGTTVYPNGENGYFYFDKLRPDQMRDVVTVQAYDSAGEKIGGTLEYSIVSYAHDVQAYDEADEAG